ncbi:hypothetical protein T07_5393 [Trichinella nelsoni]|uniref:Uncharacterized protein n=1 Tax=Trichinella nelsoni TaxID=6336 RepID=A0A0V0RJ27_9BILA|nr:hypothetical protein T07_5393 [Trichinella nelsoni]
MEREQHHITDLEKVSILAWLASPDALARCLRNDKPHDNDRSQAFCRAVVKVMPEAHSNPPPSLVFGWTCSKILAVPSQPDRGNGNAMRDDDMIVIEALLFQLHPADLLKKHAWLNPHLLVIPRTACMHVVDTRSQIINSQNRLLPICQAFESAARNGVPAPVDPLPCQPIAHYGCSGLIALHVRSGCTCPPVGFLYYLSEHLYARSPADPNTSSDGQKAEIGILLVFTLITRPDSFAFHVARKSALFLSHWPSVLELVKADGRSVGRFKERQILAALKLFVFGQACKVWPLSSLAYKTQEQSRQPRQQN